MPRCRGKRILANAGVAVGSDDQVCPRRDLGGDHQSWIGLHRDLDPCGLCSGSKPVFTVMDDDPCDFDAVLAQHVEGGHAKMAGADEGNAHGIVRPGSVGLSIARQPLMSRWGNSGVGVINRRLPEFRGMPDPSK
jgi:hypothetical protein